jgi:predicted HicB family RNase H-like nuclease
MMNYKGYLGLLHVDEKEGILRGKVINTRDTITFQGKTFEEAMQAFHDSVDDYLEFCEELGRPPEKPFTGKFVVRVRPELHRAINAIAQAKGTSVNRLVLMELTKLVRRTGTPTRTPPPVAAKPRKAAAIKLSPTEKAAAKKADVVSKPKKGVSAAK